MTVPLAVLRAAAQLLPRGGLTIIPKAGHLPHVEHPAQFLATLLTVLDPITVDDDQWRNPGHDDAGLRSCSPGWSR
jgi:hypothetical protein